MRIKRFEELPADWDFIFLGSHAFGGFLATGLARVGYRVLWLAGETKTPYPPCCGLLDLPFEIQDIPLPEWPLEWFWGNLSGLAVLSADAQFSLQPWTGAWLDLPRLTRATQVDAQSFGVEIWPLNGQISAGEVMVTLAAQNQRSFQAQQIVKFAERPTDKALWQTWHYRGLAATTGLLTGFQAPENTFYWAQITPEWGILTCLKPLGELAAFLSTVPFENCQFENCQWGEKWPSGIYRDFWLPVSEQIWELYPPQISPHPSSLAYNAYLFQMVQYMVEYFSAVQNPKLLPQTYLNLYQERLQAVWQRMALKDFSEIP